MATLEPDHVADVAVMDGIRAKLDQLTNGATTGADVAARLAAAGITGKPRECGHCPVSEYLQLGAHGRNVYVGGEHITAPPRGSVWIELPTPDVIRAFVAEFDTGKHPALLTPGTEVPDWWPGTAA